MTASNEAKAMILPQFPFLFPSVLPCFLFPGPRREKLETKAVSWAVLPMKTLGNVRETKEPKPPSVSLVVRWPQFPFLFPLDALGIE